MNNVLFGSVGCTWNFTISSAGLNDMDFDLLLRTTSSLLTVVRSVVNSSAVRALDSSSRASNVVLVSTQRVVFGSLASKITPLGPGILSFMYP